MCDETERPAKAESGRLEEQCIGQGSLRNCDRAQAWTGRTAPSAQSQHQPYLEPKEHHAGESVAGETFCVVGKHGVAWESIAEAFHTTCFCAANHTYRISLADVLLRTSEIEYDVTARPRRHTCKSTADDTVTMRGIWSKGTTGTEESHAA